LNQQGGELMTTNRTESVGGAGEPADLRARVFHLDGGQYLVLSFPVRAPSRPPALTPAEWAVAAAVLRGAKNQQIARDRGRSVNTVAKQVASIFRKLDVKSRLELARALADCPLGGSPWSG
jgi:DNA-binding NarL/FixJ family response regulator